MVSSEVCQLTLSHPNGLTYIAIHCVAMYVNYSFQLNSSNYLMVVERPTDNLHVW